MVAKSQKSNEEWRDLAIKIIRSGQVDNYLDQFVTVLKWRMSMVNFKKFQALEVGTEVQFSNTTRPARFRNLRGEVVEKKQKKVVVELFGTGRRITAPVALLEVV